MTEPGTVLILPELANPRICQKDSLLHSIDQHTCTLLFWSVKYIAMFGNSELTSIGMCGQDNSHNERL